MVIDIVDSFRLNYLGDETTQSRLYGSKKDYQSQLKGTRGVSIIWSRALIRHRIHEESCRGIEEKRS